jgi:hypothetical protein
VGEIVGVAVNDDRTAHELSNREAVGLEMSLGCAIRVRHQRWHVTSVRPMDAARRIIVATSARERWVAEAVGVHVKAVETFAETSDLGIHDDCPIILAKPHNADFGSGGVPHDRLSVAIIPIRRKSLARTGLSYGRE